MTNLQDIIMARQAAIEELTAITDKVETCFQELLASRQQMNAEFRRLESLETKAAKKLDEIDSAFANYIPQSAEEFTMQLEAIVVSTKKGIEQPCYINTIWRGAQTLVNSERAA